MTNYAAPLWLAQKGAPVAAWLHRPVGTQRAVGVVLSSSLGVEALFGYPSLIQWASALAKAGVPCLRFDPPGSGDSDGTLTTEGVLPRWLSAYAEAADVLRKDGVTDIVVAGVRLGALVAAAAAADVGARHLVAWAPYATGRAMMREMASFDQLFRQSLGPDEAASAAPPGMLDGAGARFGAELVTALEALSAKRLAFPANGRVLIIPRDDLPGGTQFNDALTAAGAEVSVRPAVGFFGAHDVPEQRKVPVAVFDTSLAWLEEQFPDSGRPVEAPPQTLEGPVARVHGVSTDERCREREVRFGPDGRLVGMLCEPEDGIVRGPGVVLVNAGLIHHVGPHRQWLEMARRWATLGIVSLRFDIGGIGQSLPPDGAQSNRPYPSWATHDVGAAMARLRAVPNVAHDVVLCGLCAGAHNSFHAARELTGIRAIVMIDPINYYMLDTDELRSAEWEAEWKTHAEYEWYTSRLTDPEAWKKLLSGHVNVAFVAKTLFRKARAVGEGYATTFLPPALSTRLFGKRGDLDGDLTRIVEKGTSTHLVFAGNAPGLWYLRMYARRALRKLPATGRFTLHIGQGADHTFSRWGWRRWLNDTITELLVPMLDRA